MSHDADSEQDSVEMYKTLHALKEGVDFMVNQLIRGSYRPQRCAGNVAHHHVCYRDGGLHPAIRFTGAEKGT